MNTLSFRLMLIEGIFALRQTLAAMIGWLFVLPLTWLIKRQTDLTVVISRPGRLFSDNSKYFFVYATELAEKG
jgi:hypothetical protein